MSRFRPTTVNLPAQPDAEVSRFVLDIPAVQSTLLSWYAQHRRLLPWRSQPDPYGVLVSEFMLQQTQAERVTPRYLAFLEQFPDFAALAQAPTSDVLRAWSGLGYNQRALRLQGIARAVVGRPDGTLPSDTDALRQLPGIGRYTAAAIACFAFGRQVATVDTNLKRVLHRLCVGGDAAARLPDAALWDLATSLIPPGQAQEWNQALMDLGATVCTARKPSCPFCPLAGHCRARQDYLHSGTPIVAVQTRPDRATGPAQPFHGSSRYYRGRIVRVLAAAPPGEALPLPRLGTQIKEDFTPYEAAWLLGVVKGLAGDGLVRLETTDGEVTVSLPEDAPNHPGDGRRRR